MSYILLDRVKRGMRLAGVPPRRVTTYIPAGWDPNSTVAYAKAVETWRKSY